MKTGTDQLQNRGTRVPKLCALHPRNLDQIRLNPAKSGYKNKKIPPRINPSLPITGTIVLTQLIVAQSPSSPVVPDRRGKNPTTVELPPDFVLGRQSGAHGMRRPTDKRWTVACGL